jgi:hypothetical protein
MGGIRRLKSARRSGELFDARVRVYLGEERRPELSEQALDSDWPLNEDLASWMRRTSGAQRFSLIVNNAETTHPDLASTLGSLLQSLFSSIGIPIGGAEQVAFIGNYSGTAFGVHEGFEDALLVHLGPGTKDFYCWPRSIIEEHTGSTEPLFGDYEWLFDSGERFVLEPGDILFLPRLVFHVGRQHDFSTSIAVPLYTFPVARLAARAVIPNLLAQLSEDSYEEPSELYDQATGPDSLTRALLLASQDLIRQLVVNDFESRLREEVDSRWLALLSNGGWEIVLNDIGRSDAARTAQYKLVAGPIRLRIPEPYCLRIRYADKTPKEVFIRGARIPLASNGDTAALAEDLQDHGEALVTMNPINTSFVEELLSSGGVVLESVGDRRQADNGL